MGIYWIYSSIVQSLSISQIPVETINIKKNGHTFIAADCFHHQVEDNVCKRYYLFDFSYYFQAIYLCVGAIEMSHEDFYDFRNYKVNGKDTNDQLTADISAVQFPKYDTKIYCKTSLDDLEFKSGQFLQKTNLQHLQ